ncbi:C-type lectin domain family 12 member A-like isoform X5 [Aquila chrysaetos chrysaetos]|uniref:C-type lectin domain family 12 member A-like isoform X5 n=1 Tax=Aquila chrysaetos chrysaetos TaxID=223781 RepID=UPI0005D0786D|nr:C-type lectin domain family 12 member A-like isoform X5 [Aquila chrysaetos chrysaetos]
MLFFLPAMTEEVTYANLKFENSHELDNITKPEDTKKKVSHLLFMTEFLPGPSTSSRSCWPVVPILLTLCLALLMALVTLAVLFFQIPKDYRKQLRDLNMTKNELHANFSNTLQAIGNQLCLEGEKNLKNNGQNCVLCPANWKWEGGDTCYYHSKTTKSWEESHQFCSSQNSTLLLIKEQAKLSLVQKFPRTSYWLGLIFRPQQRIWYWTDNTALTEEQKSWTKQINFLQPCGYVYYSTIYSRTCKEEVYYICEKPAIQLQRGNNHWQEDWFVRPE